MSTVLPHYLSMHVMWCMRRLGIQVLPYFMPLFRVSSFPSHGRPSLAAFFSSCPPSLYTLLPLVAPSLLFIFTLAVFRSSHSPFLLLLLLLPMLLKMLLMLLKMMAKTWVGLTCPYWQSFSLE